MRTAVRAVDAVHGDGILKNIPVESAKDLGRRTAGKFEYTPKGRGIGILLKEGNAFTELNAVHEIGHWLDHYAFGPPGRSRFETQFDERLDGLRNAIASSSASVELSKIISNDYVLVPHPWKPGKRTRVDTRPYRIEAKYLADGPEVFARAYAQYISERSGDPVLLGQLDALRIRRGKVYLPAQWDESDFAPIRKAFDSLFGVLGWVTKESSKAAAT